MPTTINAKRLKSGKQTVKVRLFPFPDETEITNENPFRLEIGYSKAIIAFLEKLKTEEFHNNSSIMEILNKVDIYDLAFCGKKNRYPLNIKKKTNLFLLKKVRMK